MVHNKVTVQTTVQADIDKTWNYYTMPEHITKWNFASDDWHCPAAKNDLRKGGKLVSRMESKDGKMGFDFEGTYDEIVDKKKLAYILGDGRQVDVIFEDVGDQTMVIGTFDPESENPVEMQRDGWQAILDNFKKYIESN